MTAILEMRDIVKDFPGVRALKGVSFSVRQGEIYALCGENGAGKSTLMKVLSGVHPFGTYEGEIRLKGQAEKFRNIADSEKKGIAIIAQELALVPEMSAAENIFLGREKVSSGVIQWHRTRMEAKKILDTVGLAVDPDMPVKRLGVGRQQMVEIAKALSKNAEVLILDEPTSALTEKEAERLLALLKDLKARGMTCIIISHKLKELLKVSDNITVLRDGASVGTVTTARTSEEELVRMMVGRPLKDLFQRGTMEKPGAEALRAEKFCLYDTLSPEKQVVSDATLSVRAGEITGLAGLMGAGRTELVSAVFGAFPGRVSGRLVLSGRETVIRTPAQAIRAGIALVSEDRKRFGLVLEQSVTFNTTLACVGKWTRRGIIQKHLEKARAVQYQYDLNIKTPSVDQLVKNLSGGNQQKVVLAKWLLTGPRVLIMDEPTRGIDIGAKGEIYGIIRDLARKGTAVLIVSSELPELLGICDRIYVMHEGRIKGCLNRDEADQEKIMGLATGMEMKIDHEGHEEHEGKA
ncbi:MAG: sugar ABC transporter ATP-binding protein [Planctomycetota bacterium]|jgi:D-xylose transport system ATP-binding protein